MTTLTQPPLAHLLDQLFAVDDEAALAAASAGVMREEIMRLRTSRTEYLDLYGRLSEAGLAVSRETGTLLYMLARAAKARTIVEFGTSFGVSTLCLAAALRDNGGGLVITTEFEATKIARARANLKAGGLADLVEIREGDALETLRSDIPEGVDLLLLDGAKGLYADILALVEPRLRHGALVVADDADAAPDYLTRVRAPENAYLSIPFAEDVELSMRLA